MSKFLIVYDVGCGEIAEVVAADSENQAQKIAFDKWKEAAESEAEYRAEPITFEALENYGLDPAEYGLTSTEH
jgi:hypothetical protein